MRLLLSMGLKPGGDPAAPLAPRLRWLDPETGEVVDALAREVHPDVHPGPDVHAEFTGAHRTGQVLVQTTRTEVLWLSLPDLTERRRLTHPLLHDVHDGCPLPDGAVAVSATGHDSVLVFDPEGRLRTHHWLGEPGTVHTGRGAPPPAWSARWGHVEDFRRLPFDATKPRAAHPNRVWWDDGALWTTSLVLERAICLTEDRAPLPLGGPAHDGRLLGGLRWFTTVEGRLLGFDGPRLVRHLDLSRLDPDPRLPGWCRGVERVGDTLYVGLTTLRAGWGREWLRRALRGRAGEKRPTRVVAVDLTTERLVGSWDVGNAAGGTLYGITAVS